MDRRRNHDPPAGLPTLKQIVKEDDVNSATKPHPRRNLAVNEAFEVLVIERHVSGGLFVEHQRHLRMDAPVERDQFLAEAVEPFDFRKDVGMIEVWATARDPT